MLYIDKFFIFIYIFYIYINIGRMRNTICFLKIMIANHDRINHVKLTEIVYFLF